MTARHWPSTRHTPTAHFYLAVTLEKLGASSEARPHWQTYRTLAPQGAWAELAKEFIGKGLRRCFGAAVLQCYGAATSDLRARASSVIAAA